MIIYGGAVTALNSTILERSLALSGKGNASEFTLNSLMMASVQLFGFVMTLVTGAIISPDDGDNYANLGPVYGALLFLAACAWLGTFLVARSAHVAGRSGRSRSPSVVEKLLESVINAYDSTTKAGSSVAEKGGSGEKQRYEKIPMPKGQEVDARWEEQAGTTGSNRSSGEMDPPPRQVEEELEAGGDV